MRRRDFLPAVAAAAPLLMAQAPPPGFGGSGAAGGSGRGGRGRGGPPPPLPPSNVQPVARKGRIKQGVTGGVFGRLGTLDEQCREAARLGIKGYDLINTPEQWAILKAHGLTPTMYHPDDRCRQLATGSTRRKIMTKARSRHYLIDEAAANGIPSIIIFRHAQRPSRCRGRG